MMKWAEEAIKKLFGIFLESNWFIKIIIIFLFTVTIFFTHHYYSDNIWDNISYKHKYLSISENILGDILFFLILFAILTVIYYQCYGKGKNNETDSLLKSGKLFFKTIFIILTLVIFAPRINMLFCNKVEHKYVNSTNIPFDTLKTINYSSTVLEYDSIQNKQKDTISTKPENFTSNDSTLIKKENIKKGPKKKKNFVKEKKGAFNDLRPLR